MVDEPGPVTVAGLKEAEAPVGNPLTLNDTVPGKPDAVATLAVKEVAPPGETEFEAGETDKEKSDGIVIVRVGG
jgi:hypothetical protein